MITYFESIVSNNVLLLLSFCYLKLELLRSQAKCTVLLTRYVSQALCHMNQTSFDGPFSESALARRLL